jgi:hypothetical protein
MRLNISVPASALYSLTCQLCYPALQLLLLLTFSAVKSICSSSVGVVVLVLVYQQPVQPPVTQKLCSKVRNCQTKFCAGFTGTCTGTSYSNRQILFHLCQKQLLKTCCLLGRGANRERGMAVSEADIAEVKRQGGCTICCLHFGGLRQGSPE